MIDIPIRYTRSADGTSLAYATLGAGPALVFVGTNPPLVGGIAHWLERDLDWRSRLRDDRQIIVYDTRGSGHSSRGVRDASLRAHVEDLAAVIEAAGVVRTDLFGFFNNAPVAIEYASLNPARVSSLVLHQAFSKHSALGTGGLLEVAESDWDYYVRLQAVRSASFFGVDPAVSEAAMREAIGKDDLLAIAAGLGTFDVDDRLAGVLCPTTTHPPSNRVPPVHRATEPSDGRAHPRGSPIRDRNLAEFVAFCVRAAHRRVLERGEDGS